MMKANELRIGNIVTDVFYEHFKTEIKVDSVNSKGINLEITDDGNWPELSQHFITPVYGFEKLHGIPLTPEILEKCGFLKCINADDAVLFKKQYFEIEYMEFASEQNNGFYYDNNTPYELHIKSLHQLQNLYFALTGEELEINL